MTSFVTPSRRLASCVVGPPGIFASSCARESDDRWGPLVDIVSGPLDAGTDKFKRRALRRETHADYPRAPHALEVFRLGNLHVALKRGRFIGPNDRADVGLVVPDG